MFSTWTSATAVLRRIGIALMLIAVVVLTATGLAYAQAAPAARRRAFASAFGPSASMRSARFRSCPR